MDEQRFDVAVVGLGLIGAAATRHLALAGASVVGIGPGEPVDWAAHEGVFASHYDSGRITRKLDPRREWAVLAVRAMAEYPVLEDASSTRFHHPAGIVFVEHDLDRVAALTSAGVVVGASFTVDPAGAYGGPREVAVPGDHVAIREPAPAGFIDPRRMVVAQRDVAAAAGADLRRTEARRIERSGPGFSVGLADGTSVAAERVLVTAGAFTGELGADLAALDLRPRAETVVLARLGPAEHARLADLPSVYVGLRDHPTYQDAYLVPPTAYPDGSVQLKLGATLRDRAWLPTAEDRRRWMRGAAHEADLPALRGLLEAIVPVDAERWTTRPCIITDTATGLPYVGAVADGLWVATGGNGFAAKSADAIGALAAGAVRAGRWTDPELAEEAFAPMRR